MSAHFSRREVLKLSALAFTSAGLPRLAYCEGDNTKNRTEVFDWKLHPPEEAGMSRNGPEAIRAAMQKCIDENRIPGLVSAVVRRNKLVWYEAQGWRDPIARIPMGKEDIFAMMSSTKPITAVAVLMMLDEGKLSLDDKISRFIPTFAKPKVAVRSPGSQKTDPPQFVPADRELIIKDILTHTSGLPTSGSPALKLNETLADRVPRVGSLPLEFQPGTKWNYSPLDGMDTLLRIVEIVSGMPADAFLNERVFQPLDMRDTHFNVPPEKRGRVVPLFSFGKGEWRQKSRMLGNGEDIKYLSGAGGLFSTVHDFVNFELMLLNHGTFNGARLLREETVSLMTRNHVGSMFANWIPFVTGGMGFGLGQRVVEDESKANGRGRGAFGWGGAYGTESWGDPSLDAAAAMFIQVDPGPPKPIIEFQKALRGAIVT
jgi:CubicO group peptidase (beta-lactamase class C family)